MQEHLMNAITPISEKCSPILQFMTKNEKFSQYLNQKNIPIALVIVKIDP